MVDFGGVFVTGRSVGGEVVPTVVLVVGAVGVVVVVGSSVVTPTLNVWRRDKVGKNMKVLANGFMPTCLKMDNGTMKW